MIIPQHMLSPEALHRVIEAFVTREGTDCGEHDIPQTENWFPCSNGGTRLSSLRKNPGGMIPRDPMLSCREVSRYSKDGRTPPCSL